MDSKESAQFLLDSGLLFEINRRVLHPLGMALSVMCDERGLEVQGGEMRLRQTDDEEGILFDRAAFYEGANKLEKYMDAGGLRRLTHRMAFIGFVLQEAEHLDAPLRNVADHYFEKDKTEEEMELDKEANRFSSTGFMQLACACGQVFTRVSYKDADWSCPACRVDDGVEAMAEDEGPARDLHKEGPLE